MITAAAMCALGPLCAVLGLRLMFAQPPAPEPERHLTEEVAPSTT
ncbi:hypothetical protein ACFW93_28125 [Streptomyces canus]